ncbi:MAG: alpha/beta fold hydrolase [Nitrospiraceae bacterium]|nr:alpha/beta fold hydrolase [Nitrospiraceae bacterium]
MIARINGLNLAYTDQGRGMPVVLLHAFPQNRAMWMPQVDALSKTHRIIAPDFRGFGESDAPQPPYRLDQFADDVAGLLDLLAIQQAVFIGLSMGGYTLFAFYRKYADRVKGLVLADTKAQADTEEGRAGRFAMAQTAYTKGAGAIAEIMLPKLLSPVALQTKPNLVQRVRTTIEQTQISGIAGALMAMAERPNSVPLLAQIACPTLVITGELDGPTPPADGKLMAEKILGARLEIISQAGHLSNLEQPDAFTGAVRSFLNSLT